jgi:flagellar basal-body rod protein FlgB
MELDGMFGTTVQLLGKNLDLRARNHSYIAANLANAETPGYVPSVLSFEGELKEALRSRQEERAVTTHPRHLALRGGGSPLADVEGVLVEDSSAVAGNDGNAVELEREMGRMVENQLLYHTSVQILVKKFEGLRSAIKGV